MDCLRCQAGGWQYPAARRHDPVPRWCRAARAAAGSAVAAASGGPEEGPAGGGGGSGAAAEPAGRPDGQAGRAEQGRGDDRQERAAGGAPVR